MKISDELVASEPARAVTAGNLERRDVFEMLLALVCPPLLAITAVILILGWIENVEGFVTSRDFAQNLVMLNVTGAVLLSGVILLDLRAAQKLSALAAADVRVALCMSALVSLLFLAVWMTSETERAGNPDLGAIVMFICLPMLLVCAPLLWYSARAVQRPSLRALMLAGFVMATVWAELQCQSERSNSAEDRVLMFNSLLVALAVAISLCVWGATEFRTPKAARS